MLWDTAFLSSG